MKIRLLILAIILFTNTRAQTLNRFGHFQRPTELIPLELRQSVLQNFKSDRIDEVESSLIKHMNGYIFLPGSCDGAHSTFYLLDNAGRKVFSHSFKSIIDLAFSPDKSFCIFSDLESIHVIDLTGHSIKDFPNASAFSVNNSGDALYFDEKEKTIHFANQSLVINDKACKTFFHDERPMFATTDKIFELVGNQVVELFSSPGKRIFDVYTFDGSLYTSVRTRIDGGFIFTSCRYDDNHNFELIEEVQLNNSIPDKDLKRSTEHGKAGSRDDMVENPIFYSSDTVYQPIGNSYGEMQDYGSDPYLHPGVDLLGNLAQDVRSVKKGWVKKIMTTSGPAHWRIAIANEDTTIPVIGYLYAHLDEFTIPFLQGDSVEEGDLIGQLVDFGFPGFNHCHFARVTDSAWFGAWWTLDNPLTFISSFYDSVPPVFEKTIGNDEFAFRDVNGVYLSPDSLYGQVRIISKFYDIVNSPWKVDVSRIRFSLSPLSSPLTMLLDTFSIDFSFYTDVYATGFYTTDMLNIIYSRDSTCFSVGNYADRNFYHMISNSDGNDTIDGNDALQFFNTMDYFDGDYILRVLAIDAKGNSTTDSMIIRFRNNIDGIVAPTANDVVVLPNPSHDGKFFVRNPGSEEMRYEVYDALGRCVLTGAATDNFQVDLDRSGFYLLKISGKNYSATRKLISFIR